MRCAKGTGCFCCTDQPSNTTDMSQSDSGCVWELNGRLLSPLTPSAAVAQHVRSPTPHALLPKTAHKNHKPLCTRMRLKFERFKIHTPHSAVRVLLAQERCRFSSSATSLNLHTARTCDCTDASLNLEHDQHNNAPIPPPPFAPIPPPCRSGLVSPVSLAL
jgi:hypothetical protein